MCNDYERLSTFVINYLSLSTAFIKSLCHPFSVGVSVFTIFTMQNYSNHKKKQLDIFYYPIISPSFHSHEWGNNKLTFFAEKGNILVNELHVMQPLLIANYKASKTDSFPWIITEMFYETPCENSRLNPNIDTDLGWLGYESQMKHERNT